MSTFFKYNALVITILFAISEFANFSPKAIILVGLILIFQIIDILLGG